jgi:hypothetical protein
VEIHHMCNALGALITHLSEIAVGAAAVAGAIVAWKGLDTWRHHLKGANEYELARRLLTCTYRLRDSIATARHPSLLASEMPEPPEADAKTMTNEAKRFFGTSGAYTRRWEDINVRRSALQTELLEAEAIWGQRLQPLYKTLFTLQHELWMNVFNHLRAIDPKLPESSRLAHAKLISSRREVLYDTSTPDEQDEFSHDFAQAISKIEDDLRKYLKM